MDAFSQASATTPPFPAATQNPSTVHPSVASSTNPTTSPPAAASISPESVQLGWGFAIPGRLYRWARYPLRFAPTVFACVAAIGLYSVATDNSPTTPSAEKPPVASAASSEAPPQASPQIPSNKLMYFTFAGCKACKQVEPAIQQAKADGLKVETVDWFATYEGKPGSYWWSRWGVKEAPTFIAADSTNHELARAIGIDAKNGGLATAKDIEKFVNDAKFRDKRVSVALPRPSEAVNGATKAATKPLRGLGRLLAKRPLESTVRVRVTEGSMVGFGSGTIVDSNATETIIVSCGHIFRPMLGRPQKQTIVVDLTDGKLSQPNINSPATVGYSGESYQAEILSTNAKTDVSVLRIRPGRTLACSPVVPTSYVPKPQDQLITGGASEGQAPTAWSTRFVGMTPPEALPYQGVWCTTAPKQGRSGGGLHRLETLELAGVLDFASPTDNRGLYAAPAAIHAELRKAGYGHLVRDET